MGRAWILTALALAAVGAGPGAAAQEADAEPTPKAAPAPEVGMEKLLRLPDSFRVRDERRGKWSPAEWRSRFAEAQRELDVAQADLERVRGELEKAASGASNWQIAAPGTDVQASENSPVSYRLLQQIRRLREDVARAEHQLDELLVEANLAGVPEEWRH